MRIHQLLSADKSLPIIHMDYGTVYLATPQGALFDHVESWDEEPDLLDMGLAHGSLFDDKWRHATPDEAAQLLTRRSRMMELTWCEPPLQERPQLRVIK